jgi:hypothetical protein
MLQLFMTLCMFRELFCELLLEGAKLYILPNDLALQSFRLPGNGLPLTNIDETYWAIVIQLQLKLGRRGTYAYDPELTFNSNASRTGRAELDYFMIKQLQYLLRNFRREVALRKLLPVGQVGFLNVLEYEEQAAQLGLTEQQDQFMKQHALNSAPDIQSIYAIFTSTEQVERADIPEEYKDALLKVLATSNVAVLPWAGWDEYHKDVAVNGKRVCFSELAFCWPIHCKCPLHSHLLSNSQIV